MEAEAVMEGDPIMEAEVVYPAAGYGAPPAAADDLFGPSGPYGDPMATGHVIKPLPPRSARPRESCKQRANRYARPLGISVLSVLYVLGGIFFLIFEVLAFAHRSEIEAAFQQIGVPPVLALVGVTLVALLALIAGIGMWLGTKWGWWLGAYYQVHRLFCHAAAIITLIRLANVLPAVPRGLEYQIFKYLARSAVGFLVLMYFFKENVRAFCRLKQLESGPALGALFGVGLTVTLLINCIGYFASRAGSIPASREMAAAPSNSPPANEPTPFATPADATSEPVPQMASVPSNASVADEPAPSGFAVTIWDAKQTSGGVFTVEYRVDEAASVRLSPGGAYFWIINGPSGRVQFPIAATTWATPRRQLSSRALNTGGVELNGPLTCYIEEQKGIGHRRLSNQVPVLLAAILQEPAKAANLESSPADKSILDSLGPEVTVGPYRLRLPHGMQLARHLESVVQSWMWLGPEQTPGRCNSIHIGIADLPQGPKPNDLDRELEKLKKRQAIGAVTESDSPKKVQLMGKPFIRNSSRMEGAIGNAQYWVAFIGYDGNRRVTLRFISTEPEGSQTYKLLEASLLSIR